LKRYVELPAVRRTVVSPVDSPWRIVERRRANVGSRCVVWAGVKRRAIRQDGCDHDRPGRHVVGWNSVPNHVGSAIANPVRVSCFSCGANGSQQHQIQQHKAHGSHDDLSLGGNSSMTEPYCACWECCHQAATVKRVEESLRERGCLFLGQTTPGEAFLPPQAVPSEDQA
jgi:hypothetical protein